MEKDILQLHRRLKRSKIAIFAIVVFLIVISLAVVLVSIQINQQAMTYQSKADEIDLLNDEIGSSTRVTVSIGNLRLPTSTDTTDQITPTPYNYRKLCCGDCVDEITLNGWNLVEVAGLNYSTECNSIIKCKNGKIPNPNLINNSFFRGEMECLTRDQIIERCSRIRSGQKEKCNPEKIEGWPLGDDEVFCDFKYEDMYQSCRKRVMSPPDWEKLSKEMCGCGYEWVDDPIKYCNCRDNITCLNKCLDDQKKTSECQDCVKKGGTCQLTSNTIYCLYPRCNNESIQLAPACLPSSNIYQPDVQPTSIPVDYQSTPPIYRMRGVTSTP